MDSIQAVLDSILFAEKFTPVNNALNNTASQIHTMFWKDSFNRNLRLQNVEIEIRLGKCPTTQRGPFDTSITEMQFNQMIESLQGYNEWDETHYTEEIVAYFPKIDESVRLLISSDGETTLTSKQKVSQCDYVGQNLPFDLRLSVNIELDLDFTAEYSLESSDKIVNRKRHSFSLKNVRYDMTRIVEKNGRVTHQVELEVINLPTIQLAESNAQSLTREIQARLVDLMNAVEPIRSFHIELLRKRQF